MLWASVGAISSSFYGQIIADLAVGLDVNERIGVFKWDIAGIAHPVIENLKIYEKQQKEKLNPSYNNLELLGI